MLYFIPVSYLLPSKSKPTRALFCMGEVRRKKSINFRSTPHRRKFGRRLRYHSSLGRSEGNTDESTLISIIGMVE